MATSTLIQYLDTKDASGVDLGVTPSARRQIEVFQCATAIAVGDAVVLDNAFTGTGAQGVVVKTAPFSTSGVAGIRGVSLDAVSAPTVAGTLSKVRCVVAGEATAKVAAGTAAGALLSCTAVNGTGTTVAGGGGAATLTDVMARVTSYAVALDAEASGLALVDVRPLSA